MYMYTQFTCSNFEYSGTSNKGLSQKETATSLYKRQWFQLKYPLLEGSTIDMIPLYYQYVYMYM